jgi:hypothetical protein
MKTSILIRCVVVVLVLLQSACLYDSNAGSLRLTFVDSYTKSPLSGVQAVLYNADKKTYASVNVKTSGHDGIVNFESIDESVATISFLYDGYDGKNIRTAVDIPVAAYTFPLQITEEPPAVNCTSTVTLAVDSYPAGAHSIWFEPVNSHVVDPVKSVSATICDRDRESNGNINLLAIARDANAQLVGYGYLADQALVNGATYTIAMDKTPSTFTWTSDADFPIHSAWSIGSQSNYGWVWDHEDTFPPAAIGTTGQLAIGTDVPFGENSARFEGMVGDNTVTSYIPLEGPPTSTHVSLNRSLLLSNFKFNTASKTATWATAAPDYDQTGFDIVGYDSSSSKSVYWYVALPPGTTSWTAVDLPVAAQLYASLTSGSAPNSYAVSNFDYSKISGNFWSIFQDESGLSFENIGASSTAELTYDPAPVALSARTANRDFHRRSRSLPGIARTNSR